MANWKLVGLAGLAGVAAVGVGVRRRRRTWDEPSPDELRDRLHGRLGAANDADGTDDEGDQEAGSPPA